MGRELKRVPLDFHWPLNEIWHGFINPHDAKSHKCTACDGSGETTASRRLGDLVSLLMLSGSDSLRGKCHPYFNEAPLYHTKGKVCGPDMGELTTALAGRAASFMGHDSCDKWSARKKILAAAGLPDEWGTCQECAGEGTVWDSPADKQAYDDWEQSEPPTGEGYQIWETVSEGSPISPVFATPEELAKYMAGTQWGADRGSSFETWLKFINGPGWSLTMVIDSDGIKTGPEAAF